MRPMRPIVLVCGGILAISVAAAATRVTAPPGRPSSLSSPTRTPEAGASGKAGSVTAIRPLTRAEAVGRPATSGQEAARDPADSGRVPAPPADRTGQVTDIRSGGATPLASARTSAAVASEPGRSHVAAGAQAAGTSPADTVAGVVQTSGAELPAAGRPDGSGQQDQLPVPMAGSLFRRLHGRSHFGSLHMEAAFHPDLPRSRG